MTINKFIMVCSKEDNPIGDLAKDITREEDFPFVESNDKILEYLESEINMDGLTTVFQEFKNNFKNSK